MSNADIDFTEAAEMVKTLNDVPEARAAFFRNVEAAITPAIAIAYLTLKGVKVTN